MQLIQLHRAVFSKTIFACVNRQTIYWVFLLNLYRSKI